MNIAELNRELHALGIDPRYYSLSGGSRNDTLCIQQLPAGRWCCYYTERGTQFDYVEFVSEAEACAYFLARAQILPRSNGNVREATLYTPSVSDGVWSEALRWFSTHDRFTVVLGDGWTGRIGPEPMLVTSARISGETLVLELADQWELSLWGRITTQPATEHLLITSIAHGKLRRVKGLDTVITAECTDGDMRFINFPANG